MPALFTNKLYEHQFYPEIKALENRPQGVAAAAVKFADASALFLPED